MERIKIEENGLNIVFEIDDERQLKLLHFSALPFCEKDIYSLDTNHGLRLVEAELAGLDRPHERHGNKYIVTSLGCRLKYTGHKDMHNETGRKLLFTQTDEQTGIEVDSHIQFFSGLPIVRCFNEVRNCGSEMQTLNYIASFNYGGIEKEGLLPADEKMRLHIPHNSWRKEMNWRTYSFPQLAMEYDRPGDMRRSSNMIKVTNTGNWSTKEYLPMGFLENVETGSSMFWQIEHNGSWHWEIGEQDGHAYLAVSGPDELYGHWFKNLNPGEAFTSVPVSVGVSRQGFEDAMGNLTKYRRRIRRPNADNETLRIIFNDYMNCLWADPTSEKEFPLIDAAAEVGCEYFCIDAGWYAKGYWWDAVGEWRESRERFPNGLREVTDYIRSKGMMPGLWLELEVMGINCDMAKKVPDDWFFVRHGKRIYDRSRYQLDYRNPEVRQYADEVIERLVKEYGIGYIKMDYNIEPGIGTEINADSVGDGLLEHEKAYLSWLDNIFEKYPDLVIENCSSGGLRIDYAMLSRYSIQSTSDQEDYLHYATIAANAPTGLTPEQSAIWSYPLQEGDREEVVFNMVNAILMRIHQSGHLAQLSEERRTLVKEALDYYKTIRDDIKEAVPLWPLGLSTSADEWVSMGLKAGKKIYLAVWRREGSQTHCILPIPCLKGKRVKIKCAYPSYSSSEFAWNEATAALSVRFEKNRIARLFEIEII